LSFSRMAFSLFLPSVAGEVSRSYRDGGVIES
jgi:hypothetical protein